MLSWERRYDDARRELLAVLAVAPDYLDARVGLMNVEWWTGRAGEARAQADYILQRDAGNPPARAVRQRLDAADRPWSVGVAVVHDRFNLGRANWNELALTVTRQTMAGPVVVRGSRADRFGLVDEQIEVEFYPVFRAGTYAFIGFGTAPDHTLYPKNRLALDLYQSVGRGFELSAGYRRLQFARPTDIYVASITKYIGSWMVTAKGYQIPGPGALDSTSGHAIVRRYFGADGTSFIGVTVSHGLTREEVRGVGDLRELASDTARLQIDALVSPRVRIQFDVGASRQDLATPLWQATIGTGLAVRF